MEFEYDPCPAKSAANLRKHGIDLKAVFVRRSRPEKVQLYEQH